MSGLVLIVVGVLIGLRVERWRGVFIGTAAVTGAWVVVMSAMSLMRQTDDPFLAFAFTLVSSAALFFFSLAVSALTFAIRKAIRRREAATPAPSAEPDQFRES